MTDLAALWLWILSLLFVTAPSPCAKEALSGAAARCAPAMVEQPTVTQSPPRDQPTVRQISNGL